MPPVPITSIRDASEPFDNGDMRRRNIRPFPFQPVLLLWLCLVLAGAVQGGVVSAPSADHAVNATPTDADIKTMLRDYIDTDKLGVGLVVGIVDEYGARVVSYGKLDNDTDQSVDGDTVFEIGSITKVFTALLLQDMVERGEMDAKGGQEFGGALMAATLRDCGRFGEFIRKGGVAGGKHVVPENWVDEATHPRPDTPQVNYGKLTPTGDRIGYGYSWWLYPPEKPSPNGEEAFIAEGIFAQHLYINRKERFVGVFWSAWPKPGTMKRPRKRSNLLMRRFEPHSNREPTPAR